MLLSTDAAGHIIHSKIKTNYIKSGPVWRFYGQKPQIIKPYAEIFTKWKCRGEYNLEWHYTNFMNSYKV